MKLSRHSHKQFNKGKCIL